MRIPSRVLHTGPDGLKGHASPHQREAAEGHALHQAVPESTYQWVLIFPRSAARNEQRHEREGRVLLDGS